MGLGVSTTTSSAGSVTRGAELAPSGDSSVQTIPDFYGAITGHRHTGHLIWLPDAITVGGSTWSYRSRTAYPLIYWRPGQGATPTQSATGTLATFKAAMTAGLLPPCAIVYLNTTDPDDSVEGWGMDAANGSYPLEAMVLHDIPAWLRANTRVPATPAWTAACGFSKGGFETMRMRAKWGAYHAACYVVVGAPRLDADLGGAAAAYNTFSAAEKTKLFADTSALCQAQCPLSTTAGTGLFNVHGTNAGGRGTAPLLLIESDDGAGADGDTTTRNSMNNAQTRLTTLTVTYSSTNVYGNAVAGDPDHILSEYAAAWAAEVDADANGWTMDLRWIRQAAGWPAVL